MQPWSALVLKREGVLLHVTGMTPVTDFSPLPNTTKTASYH